MAVLDFLIYWSYPYISSYILIPNPIQGQNQKIWLWGGHHVKFFFWGLAAFIKKLKKKIPIILGRFPNFLGDQCNNNNNNSPGDFQISGGAMAGGHPQPP